MTSMITATDTERVRMAEHLLREVCAGHRDANLNAKIHAFLEWGYRRDNPKRAYSAPCPDCRCPAHESKPCGQPVLGGYPYYDVCKCRQAPVPPPIGEMTLDKRTVRFMFEWIDSATEMLRQYKRETQDKKVRKTLDKLIQGTGKSVLGLVLGKKK